MELVGLDLINGLELVFEDGEHVVHDLRRGGGSPLRFAKAEGKVHTPFGNTYPLTPDQVRVITRWFEEYEA